MPTQDDIQFKELVLKNKIITEEQIEECMKELKNYEEAGIEKPLSSILIDKGYITPKQANAIYRLMGKKDKYMIRGYTLLEVLGEGGLGVVYKARQDSIGRIVALKIMYPNLTQNKEFVKRFMREAKISAQLDHPNIVRGIDFGESEGYYFFAMEYIEGESLKDIIKNKGPLEEREGAEIILQIADALKYAENHNLVHRDIKPENILMTKDGIPKLCDLGLAKYTDDVSITRTGVVMGTPYYLSPEQALGEKEVDIRSDIYSLGVTLYNMLTGDVPYKGTVMSILSQHVNYEIPDPKEKNSKLSDDICKIIKKMMAKKKEDRYQSSQELIVDLRRYLKGEKIEEDKKDKPSTKTTLIENKALNKEREAINEYLKATTINLSEEDIEEEIQQDSNKEKTSIKEKTDIEIKKDKKIKEKKSKSRIGLLIILTLLLAGVFIVNKKYNKEIKNFILKIRKKDKKDKKICKIKKIKEEPYKAWKYDQEQRQEFEKEYKKFNINKIYINKEEIKKDMVFIKGGTYLKKNKRIEVKDFWIDKYEVSNKKYLEFCKCTGKKTPYEIKREKYNYPVVNVSLYDAKLYSKWAKKELPTESEWEYVIKRFNNYEYPWGSIYIKGYANIETNRLCKINSYPKGKTRDGVYNMIGNVWEWTTTYYDSQGNNFVIKGGSYKTPISYGKASYRDGLFPYGKREDLGFRCILRGNN